MKKVLVIENDSDLLDMVDYILVGCGLKVLTSTKKLAIAEIIDLKPNLVILDHLLDDGFGADTCRELKANEATKNIPVIMISAHTGLDKIAGDCNADAWISKPFDINYFERKVEEMIS